MANWLDTVLPEHLREAVDGMSHAVIASSAEGQIFWANNAACELLQRSLRTLTDWPRFGWRHMTADPVVVEEDGLQADRAARGELVEYTIYKKYLRGDGRAIDVRLDILRVPRASAAQPSFFLVSVHPMADDQAARNNLEIRRDLQELRGAISSLSNAASVFVSMASWAERNPKLALTTAAVLGMLLFGADKLLMVGRAIGWIPPERIAVSPAPVPMAAPNGT